VRRKVSGDEYSESRSPQRAETFTTSTSATRPTEEETNGRASSNWDAIAREYMEAVRRKVSGDEHSESRSPQRPETFTTSTSATRPTEEETNGRIAPIWDKHKAFAREYMEAARRKSSFDDLYSESRSPRRAETFTPSSTSAAEQTQQIRSHRDYGELRRRERESLVDADRRPWSLEDEIALLEEKALALERANAGRPTSTREEAEELREQSARVRAEEELRSAGAWDSDADMTAAIRVRARLIQSEDRVDEAVERTNDVLKRVRAELYADMAEATSQGQV